MNDERKWSDRSHDEIMRDMKELHKDVPAERPRVLIIYDVTNTGKSTLVHLIRELEKQGAVIFDTVDVDSIKGLQQDKFWTDEYNEKLKRDIDKLINVAQKQYGSGEPIEDAYITFGEPQTGKHKAQWKREIKGRK